jgi:hypothetical protein
MRRLAILLTLCLSTVFAASLNVAVESQRRAGNDLIVQVRNDADAALTAVLVGTSDAKFASIDSLLGAHDGRLIKPGETAEVRVPGAGDAEARVMGAIFEDGALAGEPLWTSHLIVSRQLVYQQLPLALAMLRNGNVQTSSASTVAYWFRQMQDRWHASNPAQVFSVHLAAEMFLRQAGNQPADGPARELIQLFEELSAKLANSKPAL